MLALVLPALASATAVLPTDAPPSVDAQGNLTVTWDGTARTYSPAGQLLAWTRAPRVAPGPVDPATRWPARLRHADGGGNTALLADGQLTVTGAHPCTLAVPMLRRDTAAVTVDAAHAWIGGTGGGLLVDLAGCRVVAASAAAHVGSLGAVLAGDHLVAVDLRDDDLVVQRWTVPGLRLDGAFATRIGDVRDLDGQLGLLPTDVSDRLDDTRVALDLPNAPTSASARRFRVVHDRVGLVVAEGDEAVGVPIPVFDGEGTVDPSGTVLVVDRGDELSAWALADGTELWRVPLGSTQGERVGRDWLTVRDAGSWRFYHPGDGHLLGTLGWDGSWRGSGGDVGRLDVAALHGRPWNAPLPPRTALVLHPDAAELVPRDACAAPLEVLARLEPWPAAFDAELAVLQMTCAPKAPRTTPPAVGAPVATADGWTLRGAIDTLLPLPGHRALVRVDQTWTVLSPAGTPLWWTMAASVYADGDVVIGQVGADAVGWDGATGKLLWQRPARSLRREAGHVRLTDEGGSFVVDAHTGAAAAPPDETTAYGWTCERGRCTPTEPAHTTWKGYTLHLAPEDGPPVDLPGVSELGDADGGHQLARLTDGTWQVYDAHGVSLQTIAPAQEVRLRDGALWVLRDGELTALHVGAPAAVVTVPMLADPPAPAPTHFPSPRSVTVAAPSGLQGHAKTGRTAFAWFEGDTEAWHCDLRRFVDATASVVVVIDERGQVEARDRSDGRVLWVHDAVPTPDTSARLSRPRTDGAIGTNGLGQTLRFLPSTNHPYYAASDDLFVGGDHVGDVVDARTGKVLRTSRGAVIAAAREGAEVAAAETSGLHWQLVGGPGGTYALAPVGRLLLSGGAAYAQDGSFVRRLDGSRVVWQVDGVLPEPVAGARVDAGTLLYWGKTWWARLSPETGDLVDFGPIEAPPTPS